MKGNLQNIMDKAVAKGDVAGVNLLVLKEGKEIAYCESGYKDLENKIPMTRDTIFRLYSQTKPITAAAVVLLASRGEIDLSAWLSDYFPQYGDMYVNINGKRERANRQITVIDLLNMTSGLAYPNDFYEGGKQSGAVFRQIDQRLFSDNPVTTLEFAEMMSKTDLCFHPGEKFLYGTSADIAGALVEKVSGKRFSEFLQDEFFTPLGMTDTAFYVPAEKQSRLTKAYDYDKDGKLFENKTNNLGLRYYRDVPPAFESGGAGLCSTLDDYSKFATMLINGGEFGGKRILSERAVKFLTKGGLTDCQKAQLKADWDWLGGYTYGNFMRVCEDESRTSVFSNKGEYGWDGWMGTFFSNEPQGRITFLLGMQQLGIGKGGTLTRKLKNIVMSNPA
ncbi:MAG: serine hydrolase [Ruminococcaceae bacterium]|nr:serine hydrolase [Oscillospiraceae bacterium]